MHPAGFAELIRRVFHLGKELAQLRLSIPLVCHEDPAPTFTLKNQSEFPRTAFPAAWCHHVKAEHEAQSSQLPAVLLQRKQSLFHNLPLVLGTQ